MSCDHKFIDSNRCLKCKRELMTIKVGCGLCDYRDGCEAFADDPDAFAAAIEALAERMIDHAAEKHQTSKGQIAVLALSLDPPEPVQ